MICNVNAYEERKINKEEQHIKIVDKKSAIFFDFEKSKKSHSDLKKQYIFVHSKAEIFLIFWKIVYGW